MTIDPYTKALEASWAKVENKHAPNAFFKNFLWTYRSELGFQTLGCLIRELTNVLILSFSTKFYLYLESDPKQLDQALGFYPVLSDGWRSTIDFMWKRHEGFCLVFMMVCLKMPFDYFNERFVN